MEREIVKWVPGYEGLYKASNFGSIISISKIKNSHRKGVPYKCTTKDRTLHGRITRKGYFTVALYKDGKRTDRALHRLIALTFLENPHNKPQVNHKDGNKNNNKIENLEWCTDSENQKHAYDNGLCCRKGEKSAHKLKEKEVKIIKKLKGRVGCKIIANFFDVSQSTISAIHSNRNWSHVKI